MPQKEMGQHTREHVMMPSGIFAHLIVVHPQLRFRFLEALFDGPPDPTEPHQETPGRTERSVTKISNNSPPPLIVTMTSLGYMAPRSKETWYFPEVYGIIAKTGQCLSMRFNSLPYLHL